MTESLLTFSKITIHPSQSSILFSIKSQAETGKVILGKQNLKYKDFIKLLYDEIRKNEKELSGLSKHVLLHNFTEKTAFKKLYPEAPLRGLSKMLGEIIDELWEAKITSEDLEKISNEETENRFCEKLKIIAGLQVKYRDFLKKHNYNDLITQKENVITHLKAGCSFKALKNITEIEFKNIYSITELDFLLIFYLSETKKINVTFPYDPYRQDAFRFLEHTIRKFENLGEKAPNITLNYSFDFTEPNGDLKSFLKQNLFKDEISHIKKRPTDDSIDFFHAANAEEEIKYIIRQIKVLLSSGIKSKKIAIAFRKTAKYKDILLDESRKHNISLYFSSPSPIIQSPLTTLLLTPFRIIETNFEINEIINFFSNDLVSAENLSGNGKKLTRNDMEKMAAKASLIDDEAEKLEISLEQFAVKQSSQHEQLHKNAMSLKEMISGLREILSDIQTPEKIYNCLNLLFGLKFSDTDEKSDILDIYTNILTKTPEIDLLRENLAVFELFGKACNSVMEAYKQTNVAFNLEMFLTLLIEQLSLSAVPTSPEQSGIHVLNFDEIADTHFDYIFAGGLCEGEFPSLTYENIILSDEDKKKISLKLSKYEKENKQSVKRLEFLTKENKDILEDIIQRGPFVSRVMKYWEESMLFLRILQSGLKKIFYSWHTTDIDGRDTTVSYFLEHAMFLIEPDENNYPKKLLKNCSNKQKNSIFTKEDILNYISLNPNENKTITDCIVNDPDLINRIESIQHISSLENSRLENENISGQIKNSEILKIIRNKGNEDEPFSASLLEDYAHCPFVYFMKYVLNVEKIGSAEREIKAQDIGTIIHKALEIYFKKKCDKNDIEKVITEAIETESQKMQTGDKRFLKGMKNSLIITLKNWILYEELYPTDFKPDKFEYKFGEKDKKFSKNLFISNNWQKIYFKGSIDRIDAKNDAVRIVDYKNSKGGKLYDDKIKKFGIKGFQLALYANAAMTFFEKSKSKACYAFLKKTEFKEIPFEKINKETKLPEYEGYFNNWNPHEDSSDIRRFEKDLSHIIEKIYSGSFKPSGEDCDFCDFLTICRYKGIGETENE